MTRRPGGAVAVLADESADLSADHRPHGVWTQHAEDHGSPNPAGGRLQAPRAQLHRWLEPGFFSARAQRVIRIAANLVGAGGAALFAEASLRSYQQTHRLIGAVFLFEQTWVVIAYLFRRPARAVSRRSGDWLLAFGGTFGGVLFRPTGAHPHWGYDAGLGLQFLGIAICIAAFLTLGRSFGFAAADRGLVRRGPYAVVRHPIYASYLLLQTGYLLQAISVWNALVMAFITSCNIGRALAEDRMLATNEHYGAYRSHVRWRLVPGIW